MTLCSAAAASGPGIQVHGHRGATTVYPENTLAGFEYAIAQGADYIELDLWVTRDNVLVVTHDPSMNERICQGPEGAERTVRRLTLEELRRWDCGSKRRPDMPRQQTVPGARVPTFDEVLALAGRGNFRFNVEIKCDPKRPELAPEPDEYARLVVEAIRKRKLEQRVLIQSFDWRLLHATARLAPDWPRSALFPRSTAEVSRSYLEVAKEADVQRLSVHFASVTPEKVADAHAHGLQVFAWTANSTELWDRLIAAGVDGIITDDPAGLIAHLRAKGLRAATTRSGD